MTDANCIKANVQNLVQLLVENNNTKELWSSISMVPLVENNNTKEMWSSISMVPSVLRDAEPDSYNPRMISIGPLHHGDENLKEGEQLKRTCAHDLLVRLKSINTYENPLKLINIEKTLEECFIKVNESIDKIRKCYVGMRPYNDNELATMMVIDCCYILHFLCSRNTKIKKILFPENTEILSKLIKQQLGRDLLLVENQIPLFVLNDIFELTILKSLPETSLGNDLIKIILTFGNRMIFGRDITVTSVLETTDHCHILGLLHKCYKPTSNEPIQSKCTPSHYRVVELENAGVGFEPNEDASSPLAIKIDFSRVGWSLWLWAKPTLKVPQLCIQDDTKWFLQNIIAYEQTSTIDLHFTSFVKVIDDLVDSDRDITKLVDSKVICNYLGSNAEAASMINEICRNVIVDDLYLYIWKDLDTYYNKPWPNNIAWLKRTYFNNPWNVIALFAAIILFALTIVQTYFTVYSEK